MTFNSSALTIQFDTPAGGGGGGGSEANPCFPRGGDLSMVTYIEDMGAKFKYANGTEGDVFDILQSYGVNFVHLRAVSQTEQGDFYEKWTFEGDLDTYEFLRAMLEVEQARGCSIPLRPDHGHQICDDLNSAKRTNPGYTCLGRMRELAEIRGMELAIARGMQHAI